MDIRAAVSGSELDRHLNQIASTVRLSGTPGERVAFDYIESELKQMGFATNLYEAEALIGYPIASSLQITSPVTREIKCNGYALTPVTPNEGIEAELVHAGSSLLTNYDHVDARGKIVVVDGIAIEDGAVAAARAHAAGQIFINPDHIHEMCISPVWGTPEPETGAKLPSVPAIGIGPAYGVFLRDLMAQGPVMVRLTTSPHRAWTGIPTLTAELPGTVESEFVMFSGHIDSWHYGAMDNGTANATQVEVGRILAERKRELLRGVRLCFWSGHSHGRYAGSTWYADNFWQDLHDRCVVHVNIDSVGAKGATILNATSSMASTYGFAKAVLKETVDADLNYHRQGRSSDQSFWGHGVPSLFGALSMRPASGEDAGVGEIFGGVSLGWWWHTTEDLIDKIDPDFLVRDAGVYASALWKLCTEERLPFDLAAEADEMATALDKYGAASGGGLDLGGTARLARETAQCIRSAKPSSRASARTMALSRALIPVNYTGNGPFHHDLAVETKPVPGLMHAGSLAELDRRGDDWHFLRAKLLRERNRVEHALNEAIKIADRTHG